MCFGQFQRNRIIQNLPKLYGVRNLRDFLQIFEIVQVLQYLPQRLFKYPQDLPQRLSKFPQDLSQRLFKYPQDLP